MTATNELAKTVTEAIVAPARQDYYQPDGPRLQEYRTTAGEVEHACLYIPTADTPDVVVTWPAPQGLSAGKWEIAAFVPDNHATTTEAIYHIHGIKGTQAGQETNCTVNQDALFNQWAVLGTFEFDPAAGPDIRIEMQNWPHHARPAGQPAEEIAFGEIRWRLVPPFDFPYHALAGVHGPAQPGDTGWYAATFQAVKDSGVAAVKVQVCNQNTVTAGTIAELRKTAKFILARLTAPLGDLPAGGDLDPFTFFFNEIDGGTQGLRQALDAGVEYFEVLNEPNLRDEGCFVHWQSGAEFAEFFARLYEELKRRYPKAKLGFPGVSPGKVLLGRRIASSQFLQDAAPAIAMADFVCAHVYWGGPADDDPAHIETVDDAVGKLAAFCAAYPDKLVFASEFSHNQPVNNMRIKGQQYLEFYRAVKDLPRNLGGVFCYCLTSAGDYLHEVWLEPGTHISPIVEELRPHAGFLSE